MRDIGLGELDEYPWAAKVQKIFHFIGLIS